MNTYIYIYIYNIHMSICIHTPTHIHTYIHPSIHPCMHACMQTHTDAHCKLCREERGEAVLNTRVHRPVHPSLGLVEGLQKAVQSLRTTPSVLSLSLSVSLIYLLLLPRGLASLSLSLSLSLYNISGRPCPHVYRKCRASGVFWHWHKASKASLGHSLYTVGTVALDNDVAGAAAGKKTTFSDLCRLIPPAFNWTHGVPGCCGKVSGHACQKIVVAAMSSPPLNH